MAEVLLFHHAQGLTPGCRSFADRLRAAGHVVHTTADDELGDVEVARALSATIEAAELFEYPGDRHLFADDSLAAYG